MSLFPNPGENHKAVQKGQLEIEEDKVREGVELAIVISTSRIRIPSCAASKRRR